MTDEMKAKRLKLRFISENAIEQAEDLAEKEEFQDILLMSVNDKIMYFIYNINNDLIFNTFRGWLKEGFKVNKGEKAYLIWGRPLDIAKNEKLKKDLPEDEKNKKTFFPVSYIFSSNQVSKKEITT